MALSGSYDFIRTADQLIEAALRKLQLISEGQSATSAQKTTATEALNVMLKAWQAKGMSLWNMKTAYLYPLHNVNIFQLGNTSGYANYTEELILTKLTADAAASATTLAVSTTAAVDVVGTTANSDQIGIELDDGTMHWTTISSGGGTTAPVIGSGLASAASSGNRVYAYTTRAVRPEAVQMAWRVEAVTGARVELNPEAFMTVRGNAVLATEGVPIQYSHIEVYSSASAPFGQFMIWPRFQDGATYLELWVQLPFDDIDTSSTDNICFPPVWYEAVIYNLADRLAPEYGVPMDVWSAIKAEAANFYQIAEEATTEGDSLLIQPQYDPTRKY